MDADQFDALTARLTARLTRRHGLATLGIIGLAGVTLAAEADGKENTRKKRKKRRNKKTTSTSTTADPTCRDGLRNGSETDLDCGGSCPRCKQSRPAGASRTARAPSAQVERARCAPLTPTAW